MKHSKHRPPTNPSQQPRGFSTGPTWLLGLFLVAITVVAYQPVWHAGFIWDDDHFLLDNYLIHQPDGLYQFWFTTTAPDYFPMTSSMLWLEWRLWGENPLGYHLVNVFLHALSAVLWWRVLARLTVGVQASACSDGWFATPWLAAALFALHPVNVESVAWITERKNTLAMFFYAATVLMFLKFEDTGRRQWYWLSVGAFLLALLSKTAVVMLPFVLLGIAWWRRERVDRKDVWRSLPFFAVALLLGLVTVWFQYHRAIGPELVRADSFWSRLAGAGWAVWFYLYKAVLPLNLAFVYPRWQINASNLLSYAPALLVVAALVACWLYRRRVGKVWLASFGYFILMLLPVLGFLNIYFMRYSLVADHWQYFSIIGVIALTTAGIARVSNSLKKWNPLFGPALGGILLLVFGVLTWRQTGMYRDVETLWRRTVALNPGSAMAHSCLGHALMQQGRLDDAMTCFQKSLEIQPNDALVQNHLAMTLVRQGRFNEAIAVLEKALDIQPRNGEPQNNLAWLLATCPMASVRNGARAVELARESDRLSGGENPMFMETFAAACAEAGQFPEAISTAQKALEVAIRKKAVGLIDILPMRIELYQKGLPFRDETLIPDSPSTGVR